VTRWTPEQRSRAIGLALAIGADKAHDATGVPRRTISSWLSGERPAPELDALVVDSREQVAASLWEAVTVGTAEVLAGLRDPAARLGDKANALRIVAEQYALLTGGVTSRSESANLTLYEAGASAPPEERAQIDVLLRDVAEELIVGTQAARLAGVAGRIELDGLRLRANLDSGDVMAVRSLIGRLEGALAAGVSAADIVAGLTAKQIGDGDAR
jgi:hypothetical protein